MISFSTNLFFNTLTNRIPVYLYTTLISTWPTSSIDHNEYLPGSKSNWKIINKENKIEDFSDTTYVFTRSACNIFNLLSFFVVPAAIVVPFIICIMIVVIKYQLLTIIFFYLWRLVSVADCSNNNNNGGNKWKNVTHQKDDNNEIHY